MHVHLCMSAATRGVTPRAPQVLASACSVEVVDKGTLLQCVGDRPTQMTILSEGTVGLFESLHRPGNHGARARYPPSHASLVLCVRVCSEAVCNCSARREVEPAPGGLPPQPRQQELSEVGRVCKRGACFGEECLLLGETPRITACTLSR